ncbi:TonB-dependent receptor [Temperatibacter marinus]|uniref:TonB-dependent receptor n=1 Tax=Temperatibacter marinus TaxID=1456591 RepID=A0AA52H7S7_9PROT|nr:TonB-dependent receptor [Temperatibacter marinus]WND01386.1 TonB-dependent receptor [Temperatibacter marinus]
MDIKSMRRVALMGSTAVLAASLSNAAIAQDDEDEESIEEVIVTGSLIRNPNLTRSAPVAIVSSDEMELQGTLTAEEILREIPGMVPSIGQQVNNGNGGFSYVNLRGLGSNRNIVLVDGRRMSPSELNGRFDLNNIPLALVSRVDVLTGGASTTYGADALGGVVNFITKKNFTGFEANASYGVTEQGDGDTKRFEVTVGADLDDGRGNAVLSIGYQTSEAIYQGQRDFSRNVNFYWNGAVGGSGLGPFNTRFGNVNPTGEDNANLSLGAVQEDGTTFGSAFTPFNYGPFNLFQTPFERYNIYAAANYELNDHVEVYTQAMFSKNNVNTIIAPSGSFGDSVTISLNHPFLSDAQRNAFCAFDTDPTVGVYTPTFTQAECDAAGAAVDNTDPNYREVDTQLRRRNVEGGPRISDYQASYFNYSLGFRGDISDTISWDIMGSYGQSDQIQTQKGYWMKSRFRNALLAGPNGCYNDLSNGCVPADYFGYTGSITDDMNAYLQGGESTITTKFDMGQVVGNITGELDYSTPWAEDGLNFAVGAEYRSYSGSQEADLLSQSGDLGGAGAPAPNRDGGYEVYEALAEINLPLIQDAEFAKELSLEAGIRYSDYSIDADGADGFNTTTWKTGLSWAPVDDITFRATFSRAVRAPNIAELFNPVITGLTTLNTDPCSSVGDDGLPNGNGTPTGVLRDVCLAQGAPATAIGFIPAPAAGQSNSTSGGNLNLLPEESDSWTIGFILRPESIPDLTVTVDYYNITVDGSINSPAPQDALDACFNDLSTSNPACQAISRSPIDGGLSGDENIVKGLPLFLSNNGNIATDGIDFTVAYGQNFGDVEWSSNLSGNWTNSSTFQAVTGVSVNRECVGLYSGNCASIQPEFSFNWRNTFTYDKFQASLLWRFISGAEYENRDSDTAFVGTPEDYRGEWDFNETPNYNIFDLTLRYYAMENVTLTGTISNLFDKHPPLTGAFIGATGFNSGNTYPSTYDTLGRRFNIAAKITF